METKQIAIIGAGYMAREHIRAIRATPGLSLIGIYSRTKERAVVLAKEFDVPHVARSIEELYQMTKADCVISTVPELASLETARHCCHFPWQILLEKPAGLTPDETQQILLEAKESSSKVHVAFNRRFYSSVKGVLEQLQQCSDTRTVLIQDQEDQERALASGQPARVVENWMYANSVHLIDLITIFCRGTVTKVLPIAPWQNPTPAFVASSIEFDSGDRALYCGVWKGPGPWSAQILTPKIRCELRPIEQARIQLEGTRVAKDLAMHQDDIDFKPGLRRMAEALRDALNGKVNELPTIHQALSSMKLTQMIFHPTS